MDLFPRLFERDEKQFEIQSQPLPERVFPFPPQVPRSSPLPFPPSLSLFLSLSGFPFFVFRSFCLHCSLSRNRQNCAAIRLICVFGLFFAQSFGFFSCFSFAAAIFFRVREIWAKYTSSWVTRASLFFFLTLLHANSGSFETSTFCFICILSCVCSEKFVCSEPTLADSGFTANWYVIHGLWLPKAQKFF